MPEDPLVPELPEDPDVPEVPSIPEVPDSPLSPVLAKVATISSVASKGLEALLSTGETVIANHPEFSLTELIVYKTNLLVSSLFVNYKWPFIVDVESSIVLK